MSEFVCQRCAVWRPAVFKNYMEALEHAIEYHPSRVKLFLALLYVDASSRDPEYVSILKQEVLGPTRD